MPGFSSSVCVFTQSRLACDLNIAEDKTNGAIMKIKDGICYRDLPPLSCVDKLLILRFLSSFLSWNAAVLYKCVTGSLFSRMIKGSSVLTSTSKQSTADRNYSATLLAQKNREFLFHLKSFSKSFTKGLSQNCSHLTVCVFERGWSLGWRRGQWPGTCRRFLFFF